MNDQCYKRDPFKINDTKKSISNNPLQFFMRNRFKNERLKKNNPLKFYERNRLKN